MLCFSDFPVISTTIKLFINFHIVALIHTYMIGLLFEASMRQTFFISCVSNWIVNSTWSWSGRATVRGRAHPGLRPAVKTLGHPCWRLVVSEGTVLALTQWCVGHGGCIFARLTIFTATIAGRCVLTRWASCTQRECRSGPRWYRFYYFFSVNFKSFR